MKRLMTTVFVTLLLAAACSKSSNPTGYGGGGGGTTPTPGTPTPVPAAIIGTNATTFSNPNVTITHGQSVKWTLGSTHTLVIDDGAGTCVVGPISGGGSYEMAFPTAGTYQFHCTVHSSCTSGTVCTGCAGMVGTVTVN